MSRYFHELSADEKYDLVNDPAYRAEGVGGHSQMYRPVTHSDAAMRNLVGKQVATHLHAPATASIALANASGVIADSPKIYAALRGGIVQGHVEDIALFNPSIKVDKRGLLSWRDQQAQGNTGKTRHMFISGEYKGPMDNPGGRGFIPKPGGDVRFTTGESIYSPQMFDQGITNSEQFAAVAYLGNTTGIIEQDCIENVSTSPSGEVQVTKKNAPGC